MNCEKCGFYARSIYWIKGKRVCGECAANVFQRQLIRLRRKMAKLKAAKPALANQQR